MKTVIVLTTEANYIPNGFIMSSRLDEFTFVGQASTELIESAKQDPKVESIELNRIYHLN